MSELDALVKQVLDEAGRIKQASVEKVAEQQALPPATETGDLMRKLASDLRKASSGPSYADLNAFLRGGV